MNNKNTIIGTATFIFSLTSAFVSGFLVGEVVGAKRQFDKDAEIINKVSDTLEQLVVEVGEVVNEETEE